MIFHALEFMFKRPKYISSGTRTPDAALPGDVPLYYIEKHVKQTFLVDTCHHKFNHGFRKNQAISQINSGHI